MIGSQFGLRRRMTRISAPPVAAVLAVLLVHAESAAAISEQNLQVTLPSTIIADAGSPRDKDGDRLKDDMEGRLADVWRPFLEFDELENNTSDNTEQLSLRSIEPRTLFLVHLQSCAPDAISTTSPCTLVIEYRPLFRMDGGYRASDAVVGCTNHHSGDNMTVNYHLTSTDGITWTLQGMAAWSSAGQFIPESSSIGPNDVVSFRDAPFGSAESIVKAVIAYEPPLPFWPTPDGVASWPPVPDDAAVDSFLRPHPRILPSAGKHHQYMSNSHCELAPDEFCAEDCGGGERRLTDLTPLGHFTNVGERQAHETAPDFVNQPFVTELWQLGFPHEFTWEPQWYRQSCCECCVGICINPDEAETLAECEQLVSQCGGGSRVGDVFTGGMNSGPNATGAWESGAGDTCTTPVHRMFSSRPTL